MSKQDLYEQRYGKFSPTEPDKSKKPEKKVEAKKEEDDNPFLKLGGPESDK